MTVNSAVQSATNYVSSCFPLDQTNCFQQQRRTVSTVKAVSSALKSLALSNLRKKILKVLVVPDKGHFGGQFKFMYADFYPVVDA